MKRSLLVAALVTSSSAFAEFDFQVQTRYNPTGPVAGGLNFIVPDSVNGFYALGFLGVDGLIARFDSSGNVVAFRNWDSQFNGQDNARNLSRDAAGLLYATYGGSSNGCSIVQYSPTLQQNWAYFYEPGANDAVTATLDSGETAIANIVGGSVDIRILNKNGVVFRTLTIPAPSKVYAICAVPTGDSSRGFAISGRKGTQGWIARFTLGGAVLFDVQDSAMSGQLVGIFNIVADETGVISGDGRAGPTANLGFYRIAPNGAITHAFDPTFSNNSLDESGLRILDANTARCMISGAVVDFDRTTLSVLRRYLMSSGNPIAYAEHGGGTIQASSWFETDPPRFNEWTAPGTVGFLSSDMRGAAAATLSGGAAQFVGRNPTSERAAINTGRSGNVMQSEDLLLSGYSNRREVDSAIGPTNEVAILSTVSADIASPYLGVKETLAGFTASGQLKFSRAIPSVYPSEVQALEDGSYAVMGRAIANNDRFAIVRISPAGVITNTRIYNFGSGISGVVSTIPGSSDLMLMAIRETGNVALTRVKPDGSFAYNIGYSPSLSSSKLIPLASGKIAMAQVIDNGGTVLRRIDPATGLPEKSLTLPREPIRAFIDVPGPAMALVTATSGPDGVIKVRRIDETSMTVTHTATITGGRTVDAVGTGPSGRIAVATLHATTSRFIAYNGLNLTLAHPEVAMPEPVHRINEILVTNANQTYVLGVRGHFTYDPIWMGKFAADGQLIKTQETEGRGGELYATSAAIWLTGSCPTRYKGHGPFVSRYSR